jgi:dienelactone hydrolase
LFDLLTEHEEAIDNVTHHLRFDIPFLAERLRFATDWIRHHASTQKLKLGYFGASTGGAAALMAAAEPENNISAIVSRGGRPDLAAVVLPKIAAPTLLIVGGYDTQVIELNRYAFEQLCCDKRMDIVPAASHLFEEPGKLEEVARLASDWFIHKFAHSSSQSI